MDLQQQYEEAKLKVDALENIVRGFSMLALLNDDEDGAEHGLMRKYSLDLQSAKSSREQIRLESRSPLAEA